MDLHLLEIPENKIGQLKKKGFQDIESLAAFYPRKYNDFRKVLSVTQAWDHVGEMVAVKGRIDNVYEGSKTTTAIIRQEHTNKVMDIVWFNQYYIGRRLFKDRTYVFCGKIQFNYVNNHLAMLSPIYFSDDPAQFSKIFPVYPKIPGMSVEYLDKCIKTACGLLIADDDEHDYIDAETRKRLEVPAYKEFLRMVHEPQDNEDLRLAERRIVCDKLFPFAMKLGEKDYEAVKKSKFKAVSLKTMEQFIDSLPFPLTLDQGKAIDELSAKMKQGMRVEALVQGDVGCGKTVVATALAVAMVENGYQAAIMCPTMVLAEQHYETMSKQLASFNIHPVLLANGMKAKEKRAVLKEIETGKAQIVVGTHAVLSDSVQFQNLGITIVDEEHRFGVEQRDTLRMKAKDGVHHISMTATPIPRTLANTVYGKNTTVINIHTMPSGRKPVKTIAYSNEVKVYSSMYHQIQAGHQCYVVCPLIEESDRDALANVDSVEKTYQKMTAWFAQYPEVKIHMISGNMKPAEIKERIAEFAEGKCHIIISTTIIEVGVNVPNATVILIKNAERFGLAQLHQLRGRVGRGDAQSYCVLLSEQKESPRLQAMVDTNDGFEIAKRDLELRGTGDIVGTRQSGIDEGITLMLQYPELYEKIRKEVESIFEGKRRLENYSAVLRK